jgi:uncharacterized membrane protein (DUF373 family)
MEKFKKIKTDFNFKQEDEQRLQTLSPMMEQHADAFVEHFHRELGELADPLISERLASPKLYKYHRDWFIALFSGNYDKRYYQSLVAIGKTHTRMQIKPHYLSVAQNIIRDFMMDLFLEIMENREERVKYRKSFLKILGINMDVITTSYLEEEIKQYSATYRLRNFLIQFAEQFSMSMNMTLVILLILLTLGIVGLFFYDVAKLISGGLSQGVIPALGSLLMLWVMIELMNTEIDHIKGGKFKISVFIGVALVTFIRDLMIVTLKQKADETGYFLAGVTLVLGVVFWLIKKTEERE